MLLRSRLLAFVKNLRFASTTTEVLPAHRLEKWFQNAERYENALKRTHREQAAYRKQAMRHQKAVKKLASKFRRQGNLTHELVGSNKEVLKLEVRELLRNEDTDDELPDLFTEIELQISKLSSTGDGLALSKSGGHVFVVPFSIPGDTVLGKVVSHHSSDCYSVTDFVKVIHSSKDRNDSLVKCKYFSKCSGCQLQMLAYQDQLKHKRGIVENAYHHFSGLPSKSVPTVEPTMESPLQFGYRTKLTPHFDGVYRKRTADGNLKWLEIPPIGFTIKGRKKVMDIEQCPLGTKIVNRGMTMERNRVQEEIETFQSGATLLLRESTKRIAKDDPEQDINASATALPSPFLVDGSSAEIKDSSAGLEDGATEPNSDETSQPNPVIITKHPKYTEEKSCVFTSNSKSTEYVDDYIFTNNAGSFFQNNNAILSPFTAYIRSVVLPPPPLSSSSSSSSPPQQTQPHPQPSYLLDAYCGSGLFAITLSPLFTSALGIDVDTRSIIAARRNATLNHLSDNLGFIAADAVALFRDVPFPPQQTVVVIDPPRKGCSRDFLTQLVKFGPGRVVYVSCNVHSQARDVGILVREGGFEIERVRGFDFFPQTGHVEGVAVLRRKVEEKDKPVT
ncbi:MAG: hypothetical protein Q9227_004492 [Pyrenula ochraceoflavens]